MTVRYEWDIEECSAIETENLAEGDIIEHWFQESYKDVAAFMAKPNPDTSIVYEPVLVRDDDNGRSWAYMEDGKLPEYFQDAYQKDVCKVPVRFHNEVLRG